MTMQTILRPLNGQKVSVSGTSARNTTAFTHSDITIRCETACYIKLGDASVVATTSDGGYDRYLSAGVDFDMKTGGASHVAIILASGSDTAYINEHSKSAL